MRVLHENGVDLEQKTDTDNGIYPGATPLHIACLYSRVTAVEMALQLGANANATDMSGQVRRCSHCWRGLGWPDHVQSITLTAPD
jgi:hypothetical protein